MAKKEFDQTNMYQNNTPCRERPRLVDRSGKGNPGWMRVAEFNRYCRRGELPSEGDGPGDKIEFEERGSGLNESV
jgi:hypothetical protein